MRIFVDCDDTLVLWGEAAGNTGNPHYLGTEWKVNKELVVAVDKLMTDPENQLFVWSGGGTNYAQMWAERAFPHWPYRIVPKDLRIPQEGDLVIDDMEVNTNGLNMTWQKAVELYGDRADRKGEADAAAGGM